jgi:hypothetical protein
LPDELLDELTAALAHRRPWDEVAEILGRSDD